MSDVLRDWLAPVFQQQLENAVKVLRQHRTPGQHGKLDHLYWSNDEVQIQLTKGKHIQIVKSTGDGLAIVSDGTSLVQARLDSSEIKKFTSNTGRKSVALEGAIISIRSYCLVFNHEATPDKSLTLVINKFKLIGSEGSPTFGRPSNLLELPVIADVLLRLKNALSRTRRNSSPHESPSPLSQSHLTTSSYPVPTASILQEEFSTQLPYPVAGKKRSLVASTVKPVSNTNSDLLSVLKNNQHLKPSIPKHIAACDKRRANLIETKSIGKQGHQIEDAVQDLMMTIVDSGTHKQPTRTPPSFQLPQSKDIVTGPLSTDLGSSVPLPVIENDQTKTDSMPQMPPTGRTKFVSKHCEVVDILTNSKAEASNEAYQARLSAVVFRDQFQIVNPFEGLKRVPRKFVRIPETQHLLLEGDSWFVPRHDDHSSYAFLPSNVSKDIAAFVNNPPSLNSAAKVGNSQSSAQRIVEEDSDEDMENNDVRVDRDVNQVPHEALAFNHDRVDESPSTLFYRHNESEAFPSQVTESHSLQSPNKSLSYQGFGEQSEMDLGDESLPSNIPSHMELIQEISKQSFEGLPEPSIPNRNVYKRASFPIPPSSPSAEEPLELAVPYAVGDTIDDVEHDNEEYMPKSQLLPSTDEQIPQAVQVKQTPFAHTLDEASFRSTPTRQRKRRLEELSSDHIIPATFHDSSSRPLQSGIFDEESADSEHLISQEDQDPVIASSRRSSEDGDEGRASKGPNLASGEANPLLNGSVSSQLLQNLSPEAPMGLSSNPLSNKEDSCPATPQTPFAGLISLNSSPQFVTPLDCTTPFFQNASSPRCSNLTVGDENSEIRNSLTNPQSNSSRKSFGSNNVSINSRQQNQKLKRPPIPNPREEDCPVRDTREMARASRHSFINTLSKSVEPASSSATSMRKSSAAVPAMSTFSSLAPAHNSRKVVIRREPSLSLAHIEQESSLMSEQPPTEDSLSNGQLSIDEAHLQSRSTLFPHEARSLVSEPPEETPSDDVCLQLPGQSTPNFWEQFKMKYPDYKGSQRNFTTALVYIEWLRSEKQLLHRSLCDDLIRVYATEYLDYLRECGPLQSKPLLPCWEFYDKNIMKPVYQEEFIMPENLQQAILSLDPAEVDKFRRRFSAEQTSDETNGPISYAASRASEVIEGSAVGSELPSELRCNGWSHQKGRNDRVISTDITSIRKPFFETPSQQTDAKPDEVNLSIARHANELRPRVFPSAHSMGGTLAGGQGQRLFAAETANEQPPKYRKTASWAQRQEIPPAGGDFQSPSTAKSTSKPESKRRSLPWVSPNTSLTAGGHAQIPMSTERKELGTAAKAKQRSATRAPRPSPASPILGNIDGPVSRPSMSIAQADPLTSQDKPTPSRPTEGLASKSDSESGSVGSWLSGVPGPISFEEMVKRKRLSGGFASRLSTPGSTPSKRFCTEPLKPRADED